MKRKIGAFLTILGLLLLVYTLIASVRRSTKVISPVPLKEGVKVIELSPSP